MVSGGIVRSSKWPPQDTIIGFDDPILITGANGFVGRKVVTKMLACGYRNIRCLVRSPLGAAALSALTAAYDQTRVEVIVGNLLSKADCDRAAKGARVVSG